ncbi:DNA-binding protein [Ktedonosporobacter rubrisoli]|uniref:DNA-binding protein n=2 Tax=Ktedonosporobacter rubrisoli TaxID=2509675 RepID=A0A4P6K764_KTERU|nr:DNA-binding protein [Ktedonosporobacter rubrisoli]
MTPKSQGARQNEDDLLTIREVAKSLRVDTTTVRRWITHGIMDAILLPHRGARQTYRIRKKTLDNLLSGTTTLPKEEEEPRSEH